MAGPATTRSSAAWAPTFSSAATATTRSPEAPATTPSSAGPATTSTSSTALAVAGSRMPTRAMAPVFSTDHLRLSANVENLVLQGGADLQGYGNGLNNVLTGNAGSNLLDGDAGADVMVGGAGNDALLRRQCRRRGGRECQRRQRRRL